MPAAVMTGKTFEKMPPNSTRCFPKQTELEFTKSQKGKRVLVHLGFEYLLFRSTNGIETWRCRQSRSMKCHSILKIKETIMVQEPTKHCHISITPRTAVGKVLNKLNEDVFAHTPKQPPHYRKKNTYLPNPTAANFHIPEKYNNLVLHDTGLNDPERILVLGDEKLLLQLERDIIYGDGSFEKVSSMFFQLYVWYAKVGNAHPPCVYFLLHKKNFHSYCRMFEIMKHLVGNLQPKKILVDFDKALMTAALTAFPEAEVKGWYFHLCRDVIKRVSEGELKEEFEADINVKLKLKSLAALAFVPTEDVKTVFNELAFTFPNEDSYNHILSYFYSNYIEGVIGRDPLYPVGLWNYYDAALEQSPETTVYCEGFHNRLNSLYEDHKLSVWFLLDGLQKDLACHKLILANAEVDNPEGKVKKLNELLLLVATAVEEYHQEEDKITYLKQFANLV